MRYLLLLLLLNTGCSFGPQEEQFAFGDKVVVVSGPYRRAHAVVAYPLKEGSPFRIGCKTGEYYAQISRNGLTVFEHICHEDIRSE